MSVRSSQLSDKQSTTSKASKTVRFKVTTSKVKHPADRIRDLPFPETKQAMGNTVGKRIIIPNKVVPLSDDCGNKNIRDVILSKKQTDEVSHKPRRLKTIVEISHGKKGKKKPMFNQSTFTREKESKNQESGKIDSDTNGSVQTSLPARSEILPPDGDSLRSNGDKISVVSGKCPECLDILLRLSKAHSRKVEIESALEKAQKELSTCKKQLKILEKERDDSKQELEEAMSHIRELDTDLCQLQKEKAQMIHELHVTRKHLTRALEHQHHTDDSVSDISHVSSVFVPGVRKNSDDGLGEDASLDEEEDSGVVLQWRKKDEDQNNFFNSELNKLREVERRNEELQIALKIYDQKVNELQKQLRSLDKPVAEKCHSSTQTVRRDSTFTKAPSEKTKIPKRLFGHHSSLPVICDPSRVPKLSSHSPSLTQVEKMHRNSMTKSSLDSVLQQQKNSSDSFQLPKIRELQLENEKLESELKLVKEKYQKEMVLRKKYFNIAEELKGKIRVYCRIKPKDDVPKNSTNFMESPDDYTVLLSTIRGKYEFNFDSVFTPDHTQDDIFKDVQNLVQSALDGYNVCIFAYGQTGSGKTFTLVGNDSQPGIGPRAFQKIFQLVREKQSEQDFRIHASIFELYNDRLIDLLKDANEENLKIRRDSYGVVYVQGSETRPVRNEKELLRLFYEACGNRHTSATRMNIESSRSHLIVTVFLESTNKITGTLLKGKLNIVDLAGSERTGKTAVVADQLKEANSINKSLSALGDVIVALTSEQSYVPYRNNKLTLLMQDSLGNNAKTLMFVTISSSELNAEESLNSLMYASRVKQITNNISRMSECKEIARLKSIIAKLTREDRISGRI